MRTTLRFSLLSTLASLLIHGGVLAQVCGTLAFPTPLSPGALEVGSGYGSALDVDGDRAVVGAPEQHGGKGSVFVHELKNGTWTSGVEISPPGLAAGDRFGAAVALSGDWLFVGAPNDDDKGADAGAVHVFQRAWIFADNYIWVQHAKLLGADVQAGDQFGAALAADEPVLIVGAPNHDGALPDDGVAYAFELDGWWKPTAKLDGADSIGERLGFSVTVDGNVAVVGGPGNIHYGWKNAGHAFVFERKTSGGVAWHRVAEIQPSLDLDTDRQFGFSVALSGSRLLVGAPGVKRFGAAFAGAAYLFEMVGSAAQWTSPSRIQPQQSGAWTRFGAGVALTLNQGLVAGSSRVVRFDYDYTSGWSEVGPLVAPFDPLPWNGIYPLGPAIAASNANVMVGRAPTYAYEIGVVYPFHACGGKWIVSGPGSAGTNGVPALAGAGPLQDGTPLELRVSSGRPSSPAVIFVHVGEPSNVPFLGGNLYAFEPHLSIPLMLTPAGSAFLPAVIPIGVANVKFVLQIAIVDPVASGGASLSNGLELVVGI